MTYETLVFLRNVLSQLSLRVAEPDFPTTAISVIRAIEELDKEIADAGDPL